MPSTESAGPEASFKSDAIFKEIERKLNEVKLFVW